MTTSMDAHDEEKKTDPNLIVRSCKSEVEVTNSRRLHSMCCTIEAAVRHEASCDLSATAVLLVLVILTTKGLFIATQLNSMSSWITLVGCCRHFADATRRWVELHRYRHPHWVTTFRADRWQLFTLWTCRQLGVVLSWVELHRRRYRHFADATQLDVELSWVKRALTDNYAIYCSHRYLCRLLQSIFQSLCDVEVTLIPPDTRMPCSEVVSIYDALSM